MKRTYPRVRHPAVGGLGPGRTSRRRLTNEHQGSRYWPNHPHGARLYQLAHAHGPHSTRAQVGGHAVGWRAHKPFSAGQCPWHAPDLGLHMGIRAPPDLGRRRVRHSMGGHLPRVTNGVRRVR